MLTKNIGGGEKSNSGKASREKKIKKKVSEGEGRDLQIYGLRQEREN